MRWTCIAIALLFVGTVLGQDCDVDNGGCEHNCDEDRNGRAVCSCDDFFTLDKNKKTCTEDLCTTQKCPDVLQGPAFVCTQESKTKINCSCITGYLTHKSKKYCVEDLCLQDNNGCGERCSYDKQNDKFVCSCDTDWEVLDVTGKICVERDLCEADNGGCAHICTSYGGKFTKCSCNAGMVLAADGKTCVVRTGKAINYCGSNQCDHFCKSLSDTFECSCRVGYELDPVTKRKCNDVYKPIVAPMALYLGAKGIDFCARASTKQRPNGGCAHTCVNTLYNKICVCDRGYVEENDGAKCIKESSWTKTHTIIVIVVLVVLLLILILICCLCAKWKLLRDNICCKSFVSWKCCMTGCFCKCNKGEASDTTMLHYHDVSIQVKNYQEEGEKL